MLDEEEIRELWKSVEHVTSDDAKRMMKKQLPRIRPIPMSNGYLALLSLDVHEDGHKEYHLSISNPFGVPSFETAAAMAREILGECDQLDVGFRGIYHFVKDANTDNKNINKGGE